MAAEENLIKKADLVKAREIEFVTLFGESIQKLVEALGGEVIKISATSDNHINAMVYIEREDREVCRDCLDRSYTVCDQCGEYVRIDDSYGVIGKNGLSVTVCPECAKEYDVCPHCGERISRKGESCPNCGCVIENEEEDAA